MYYYSILLAFTVLYLITLPTCFSHKIYSFPLKRICTGYQIVNSTHCEDIKECNDSTLNNCDANAVCNEADGGFSCQCSPRYADTSASGQQGLSCNCKCLN